ncbi:MAG: MFS transporter [Pseudomonadota bacterium]
MAEESALRKTIREIVDPFKSLAGSSQALWALYISYWFEGLVYFGILTVLGKYLSENVGLADLHAGWVYSGFTGGITLSMLFLGGVADRLGVRKALLLALGLMVIGRLLLGASGAVFEHGQGASSGMFLMVTLGLAVVVVGYGMYQPAAYAAVKQFTDEKTATMGYAMIYGLMNLGAFFSGILSPAVRKSLGPKLGSLLGVPPGQDMGIVAVLLVYIFLTLLAFLTIWFFMTRRSVARDTLTNIDAPKPEAVQVDGETAGGAPPRAKLLTPGFLVLAGGSVAATVAVIVLALSAAPTPSESAMADAKGAYKAANKALAGDEVTGETQVNLGKAAEDLAATIADVHPGELLPGGTEIDGAAFEGIRGILVRDAAALRSFAPALGAEFVPGSGTALAARDQLRTLGLWCMTIAYGRVSEVDDKVLVRLRSRMKESDEDAIPLEGDVASALVDSTGHHDLGEQLRAISAAMASTAARLRELAPETAGILVPILDAERAFFDGLGGIPADTPGVSALLQERLLNTAVLLLKGLPPVLKGGEDSEPAHGKDLVVAWLGSAGGFTNSMGEAAASAVEIPTSDRLIRWGVRYGMVLLVGLFLLIFTGVSLLRKRPDHPFNDVRFVFFIFVLIPVQTLFAHNWLTLPYYIDRAFGGTAVGDNFEFFSNINPILIFFLAPAVAALTTRAKVYPMMIWGTLVMAAPTFLLVLPPSPTLLLTYILLMSIGEAMWQPRFLQWVAEIAPEGQTGMYMGIGQFPWFLTKVITGLYSGYFLSQYCPMVGPQDTQTMWLFYALIAMVSPVALWMARGWMSKAVGNKAMG